MASVAHTKAAKYDRGAVVHDERWDLVQRVLASRQFQKSARLREFLSYVTDRVLNESGAEVHEQEIASKVFLRPEEGSKGEDTIVRVQAYQLRKRLEHYFATDGSHEQLIVKIPKGNYAPVFLRREPASVIAVAEVTPTRRRDIRTGLIWLLAGMTMILAAVCSVLAFRNPATFVPAARMSATGVSQFWSQFAHKNRRVDIVLADSSLSLLADILHRPPTLGEYLNRDYWSQTEKLQRAELREAARMIMSRQHTSIGDANLASKISVLSGRENANVTLFFARDFHIRHLRTDDIVLLGSNRSNPWTELFENHLNFRFVYDEQTHTATIENKVPMQGEAPRFYVGGKRNQMQEGYCRIAFLPNTGRSASVLLIAGTEMEGTEAGGEFLTSEAGISQLRRLLQLNPSDPFPYFEVLLKTTRIGGAAPSFEVVTYRLPRV